jgi:hypothetical protein
MPSMLARMETPVGYVEADTQLLLALLHTFSSVV